MDFDRFRWILLVFKGVFKVWQGFETVSRLDLGVEGRSEEVMGRTIV